MTALLDTGFLLAILDADDKLHHVCSQALQVEPDPILPDVVLPELAYMVLRELGYPVLISFLQALQRGELPVQKYTPQDLTRTTEILAKYADSHVDFVDCAIVRLWQWQNALIFNIS